MPTFVYSLVAEVAGDNLLTGSIITFSVEAESQEEAEARIFAELSRVQTMVVFEDS